VNIELQSLAEQVFGILHGDPDALSEVSFVFTQLEEEWDRALLQQRLEWMIAKDSEWSPTSQSIFRTIIRLMEHPHRFHRDQVIFFRPRWGQTGSNRLYAIFRRMERLPGCCLEQFALPFRLRQTLGQALDDMPALVTPLQSQKRWNDLVFALLLLARWDDARVFQSLQRSCQALCQEESFQDRLIARLRAYHALDTPTTEAFEELVRALRDQTFDAPSKSTSPPTSTGPAVPAVISSPCPAPTVSHQVRTPSSPLSVRTKLENLLQQGEFDYALAGWLWGGYAAAEPPHTDDVLRVELENRLVHQQRCLIQYLRKENWSQAEHIIEQLNAFCDQVANQSDVLVQQAMTILEEAGIIIYEFLERVAKQNTEAVSLESLVPLVQGFDSILPVRSVCHSLALEEAWSCVRVATTSTIEKVLHENADHLLDDRESFSEQLSFLDRVEQLSTMKNSPECVRHILSETQRQVKENLVQLMYSCLDGMEEELWIESYEKFKKFRLAILLAHHIPSVVTMISETKSQVDASLRNVLTSITEFIRQNQWDDADHLLSQLPLHCQRHARQQAIQHVRARVRTMQQILLDPFRDCEGNPRVDHIAQVNRLLSELNQFFVWVDTQETSLLFQEEHKFLAHQRQLFSECVNQLDSKISKNIQSLSGLIKPDHEIWYSLPLSSVQLAQTRLQPY